MTLFFPHSLKSKRKRIYLLTNLLPQTITSIVQYQQKHGQCPRTATAIESLPWQILFIYFFYLILFHSTRIFQFAGRWSVHAKVSFYEPVPSYNACFVYIYMLDSMECELSILYRFWGHLHRWPWRLQVTQWSCCTLSEDSQTTHQQKFAYESQLEHYWMC